LFEYLTFVDSPAQHLVLGCTNTEIRFVNITAPGSGFLNTDGAYTNATGFYIHDSYISVGDDNVHAHNNDTLVENCYFAQGHGASIGSDVGWSKNITFRGITFNGTIQAIRIKTKPGDNGMLYNVLYENLVMYNVGRLLCITMYYINSPAFAGCPVGNDTVVTSMQIRDITIRNVTAYNVETQIGFIQCQPSSPCKNIKLIDFYAKGNSSWECHNVCGTSVNVVPESCLGTCP